MTFKTKIGIIAKPELWLNLVWLKRLGAVETAAAAEHLQSHARVAPQAPRRPSPCLCWVALPRFSPTLPRSHQDTRHWVETRQSFPKGLYTDSLVPSGVGNTGMPGSSEEPGYFLKESSLLPAHLGKAGGINKLGVGLGRPQDKGKGYRIGICTFRLPNVLYLNRTAFGGTAHAQVQCHKHGSATSITPNLLIF